MKMYDERSTGIAIKSDFVETHAGSLHVYADRTQAGNIVFITTDNFKKYIPIDWIKEWYKTHVCFLKEEKGRLQNQKSLNTVRNSQQSMQFRLNGYGIG